MADVGFEWSCGLVGDGTVRCWGRDFCTEQAPSPVETFTQISVGLFEMCAVRTEGTVSCHCCDAPFGQGSPKICSDAPQGSFSRVEVGSVEACAQDAAGALTCWGGPAALENFGARPAGAVLDFALEENDGAAILEDGSIQVWGVGDSALEPAPIGEFADVAAGRSYYCALHTDGTGVCWGRDGSGNDWPQPPLGAFDQIVAFQGNSCVIDAGGAATCWHGEDFGIEPWPIPMPDVLFAQIGLGEMDACGVDLTGQAYCWGGGPGDDFPWLDVPLLGP